MKIKLDSPIIAPNKSNCLFKLFIHSKIKINDTFIPGCVVVLELLVPLGDVF